MKIDFDSYAGFLANRQNMKATLIAKMFVNNVAEANEVTFNNEETNLLAYGLTQNFHSLNWEFANKEELKKAQDLADRFEYLLKIALEKKGIEHEYASTVFLSIYRYTVDAYASNPYCLF